MRHVVAVGRDLGPDHELIAPPPAVWENIAAQTSAEPPAERAPSTTAEPAPAPEAESRGPRGRMAWVLAAAVAGIAAGIGGVLGWQALQPDDEPAVVARAELDPLAEYTIAGSASVIDVNGERELEVQLDSSPVVDGFLQVWLLTPDATGLVSLGVLHGDTITLAVPDGLELDEFPVVDVSVEAFDGDPSHSGNSVVRGALSTDV
nr:anti-sigma factor [Phytoactinopolyspora alkaliphila]